ncbi:MAG: cache domain-containing protein [Chloroflexota bacterium]
MWSTEQILQYSAWFLSLVEFIVALYVVVLNPRQSGNRYTGLMLFILAAHTYGLGSLANAADDQAALFGSSIIAVTQAALPPVMLLAAVALLQPDWLHRPRLRLPVYGLLLLAALPLLLTLLDRLVLHGTQAAPLFYSGLDPAAYSSGYVPAGRYLQGSLSFLVYLVNFGLVGLGMLAFLLYCAFIDRGLLAAQRRVARALLVVNVLTPTTIAVSEPLLSLISALAASLLVMLTYSTITFRGLTAERRPPRGSLVSRLTALILITSIPLLAAMAMFLTDQARQELERDASQSLAASNRAALESIEIWLAFNSRALKTLAQDREVTGMDPASQQPVLQAFVATYPDIYLAGTTDLTGQNLARSDGRAPANYSNQAWFVSARSGRDISYQVSLQSEVGEPVIIFGAPVRDRSGQVVGTAMFATRLEQLRRLVSQTSFTRTGEVFLVDERNYILTHSDREIKTGTSFKDAPAVQRLRSGQIGSLRFTDEQGLSWRAQVNVLTNGWGLVVQQDEASLLAPIRAFQGLGLVVMLVGALTLLALSASAVSQGLRPVQVLTDTARAIAGGDLAAVARVESEDELGLLAEAFNSMNAQLRELISGLEQRVSERTRDLERRSEQLQVTAEVAREAAAIRSPAQLLSDVTRRISERLGHYHVGIFLIESERAGASGQPAVSYAVLKAANSDGGQVMLARGHRLQVGQVGIVGYVAASGRPRIALDTGRDAVFFNNPDLPNTHSEVALPLKAGERVIGVLDVQSKKTGAFGEEDLATLQILADQVALAIENARLIEESRQTVRELENLYGRQLTQGWQKRLGGGRLGYAMEGDRLQPLVDGIPEAPAELETGGDLQAEIALRGRRLGRLKLRRPPESGAWTPQEQELVGAAVAQLAQSLENARLLEEIQTRARQEEQINRIAAQLQSSLNLETVMRTAVQELVQSANLARVRLRLGRPDESGVGSRSENETEMGGQAR